MLHAFTPLPAAPRVPMRVNVATSTFEPGDLTSGEAVPPETPLIEVRGISKRFDATQALSDATIAIRAGEVHALVGENGAGKSTLINIMTGIHQPDAGTILVNGQEVVFRSAADAQTHGIAAIHQEPLIFPDLNVAENIFTGQHGRSAWINWSALHREAEDLLSQLDVKLDPAMPASYLSVATQQAVEIARAMSLDLHVLIMDEPTAALSAHEVSNLFDQVRRLVARGVAVLFISHRLDEVFEIADRITVFRDGKRVSTALRGDVTETSLVKDMVGRDMSEFFTRSLREPGSVAVRVSALGREGTFEGITFEVRHGEILGMAGLVGSGRTDVALALFGIAPADVGTVELDGREVAIGSPRDAMRLGIAYLSEDRRQLGLSMTQSIAANITLASLPQYARRFGLIDREAERRTAEAYREQLHIRTPSVDAPVEQLSGGNQQKAMLAKWLNVGPKLLILDEPTRGIDVATKAEVHQIVDQLAQSGIAIILISSDLPEVLAMSDRILVMREGRQQAIFRHDAATEEIVMTAAMGVA
jgi:rhamnose transport system ATP-binding protein